ncbi:PP2C family protein-serine/threonine phosphatase [Actinomadura fulvescens]|uniref:PP2C family protein-serine/threonine phosphatase n=1 Tax=Actinomadura fulvescens TaxID=46160 RepID=A0ABN3QN85_9ACTN
MRSQMHSDRAWLWLALTADTAIAAADAALTNNVIFIGLLIVGPLLASARLKSAATALVGGYAVLLGLALGVPDHIFGSHDHLLRCLIVAVGGAFATLTAYIRTNREDALTHMTHVAEVAQQALLRPIPPDIGGLAFAHRYRSAARKAQIGGDLYDVALTPHGLRLIIGDVKGKGLPAIQQAAAVLRCFRETVFTTAALTHLAKELDARIAPELAAEDFVTVLLAEFIPGHVRLVNCGHPPPLRIGSHTQLLDAPQPSPPLGLDPEPVLQYAHLTAGERLLFFTDGLIEAKDPYGAMFPLDERVSAILRTPFLDEALQGLLDLVLTHTHGHFHDDLAMVLCQPSPATSHDQPSDRHPERAP